MTYILIGAAVLALGAVAFVLLVGANGCRREEREDWHDEGGAR